MIEGIIGKKMGMTQVFDENRNRIPVTVIEAGPCRVVQVKTQPTDGYEAVQLGFGEKKHSRIRKPQRGHAQKTGVAVPRLLREFRLMGGDVPQAGQEIKVDLFEVGEFVDITGLTLGRGFQGVVKRHGFHGGPGGHGSMFHRAPGSIGCRAVPGFVHKGKRMGGHMGVERCTIQRLRVIAVDVTKNMLVVKGSVPGSNYGYLEIRKSMKTRKK